MMTTKTSYSVSRPRRTVSQQLVISYCLFYCLVVSNDCFVFYCIMLGLIEVMFISCLRLATGHHITESS